MGTISTWMADLFNGISPADIPLFFVQILTPVLIGWLLLKTSDKTQHSSEIILITAIVAFGIILSKQSVELSISFSGLMIAFLPRIKAVLENMTHPLVFILSLAAGWGCGAGFVAITAMIYLLIFIPLMYFINKK